MQLTSPRAAVAVVLLGFGVACTKAREPLPPSGTEPAAMGDVIEAGAEASPSVPLPPGEHACRTNEDCRTRSSYCAEAPCACLALGAGDEEPHCASPNAVRCFADPCMRKAAECQNQRCVIVKKSSER